MAKAQNNKIIFGIKIKQLRKAKGLSFKELSERSGVSISYLNEIEKGKKYPKEDKIRSLAKVLDSNYEELVSEELSKNLASISELLQSNFLSELPLDIFGIELIKIVELIADAPVRVGAFISTIMEIARNYALEQEHFYFATLRSFQELHHNYFEELEDAVDQFIEDYRLSSDSLIPVQALYEILEHHYHIKIDKDRLEDYPELSSFRSIYLKDKKTLLVNKNLTQQQQAFLLGKEIGFNYLKLKTRIYTSNFLKVRSFEQVLNNFKASYFSGALLMNKNLMVKDIRNFFDMAHWDGEAFLSIMRKYEATPEMFLHRLTNLLPRFFGINKLFFLRFNNALGSEDYDITKELHLYGNHRPQSNGLREHYCRRWIAIWALKELENNLALEDYSGPTVYAQRSKYFGTEDEYLCFTIARTGSPTPDVNLSITIGLLIDEALEKTIAFVQDVPQKTVNQTCQRCPIMDCNDRAAEPLTVQLNEKNTAKQEALKKLFNET